MANDNQSRENPSRQQTAERSQTGSAQQGTGAARGTPATGTSAGQGGPEQTGGAMHTRHAASSITPHSSASSGYGGGPFSMMRRITDEMDRMFENFGMGRSLFPGASAQGRSWDAGSYGGTVAAMWSPRIEVCERNGKMLIQADLPGMKRDDVHVRIEQDEVIIQGERRQDESNQQGGYYRSERSYGSFYRTIPLPEGTDADSANATFRDGVLEIELDAPRQQHGRTLEIRDAGSSPAGSRAGTGSGATYGAQQASGTSGSQQSASGTSKGTNT